jgi:putative transposase
MLSDTEFDAWANGLGLSETAKAILTRIRASAPERRVTNTAGNFCGSFPSEKLGQTIQWESWTGERAMVLLWEVDGDCLEAWDQALKPKISYVLPSGQRSGTRTTIDYLALLRNWVGGVDYKTSAELQKLTETAPYRWIQTDTKTWDQPPAREALKNIGLGYRLFSEWDIPQILVRNVDFLRPRLLRAVEIPEQAARSLKSRLLETRRVLLTDAIALVGDADVIYEGHFQRRWYLELRQEPLALPDNAWVYRDQIACQMFQAIDRSSNPLLLDHVDPDRIAKGSNLVWAGQSYQLLNRTAAEVFLLAAGQPLVQMQQADFRRLVRTREISTNAPMPTTTTAGLEVLQQATDAAIDEAIEKLKVLDLVRTGTKVSEAGVARRTYYDWRTQYNEGETSYANGFIGLIPRHDQKGNRTPRTEPDEIALLQKAFVWLRNQVPREPKAGYSYYVGLCADTIEPRSFVSFNDAWNSEDQYKATKDREGERAAYPVKAPRSTEGIHLAQGPPEGDSPFARVHIDHMISDTFCRRMNSTQLLGKPWFTIAIDAFTRLVLALWISMLAPSHASVMMVLRDMIRRHGRLPMTTITDGGKDFKAKRVARFLAASRAEHALRPRSEPRFGNPVERLNLDINHHLTKVLHGSNEVLKTPRMSSASHDPRDLAYLTVPMLAAHVEDLLFNKYPQKPHAGLQSTPDEAMRSAGILQGSSWGVPLLFDEQAVFRTLAQPHKHGGLMRQRDGIRLNSHNYYSDALVGRDNEKLQDVPLYDPEDPTYIFVRLDGRWSRCKMIDSQLKRLPPPEHRRYYLGEHIYLARPSSSKTEQRAFEASMGGMYQDIDAERDCYLREGVNDAASEAPEQQPSATPASPPPAAPSPYSTEDAETGTHGSGTHGPLKLVAAPISRRTVGE